MKNIIDEINKRYENLTKSQKIIADFLLENYALVPFETLNEIAHRIGLSTTSLIRFSRTMGYKDYTDLKKNIQDLIKVKVSLPSRFGELSEQGGTPNDLLLRCRDIAVNNIEATLRLQDTEKLDLAVDWISSANHNYVLGLRTCFSPAFYLAVVLSQIKKKVRLIQGIASTYPEEITDVEAQRIHAAWILCLYLFKQFAVQIRASLHDFVALFLACIGGIPNYTCIQVILLHQGEGSLEVVQHAFTCCLAWRDLPLGVDEAVGLARYSQVHMYLVGIQGQSHRGLRLICMPHKCIQCFLVVSQEIIPGAADGKVSLDT